MYKKKWLKTNPIIYKGLLYNPKTGDFIWINPNKYRSHLKNKKAGSIDTNGYLQIRIENKIYQAHRLAWFLVTGRWPKNQIDHKDRNILNNKFKNLREYTNRENSLNRKDNTKTPGVRKIGKKYAARIKINYKEIHLGMFHTEDEAVEAYKKKFEEVQNGL